MIEFAVFFIKMFWKTLHRLRIEVVHLVFSFLHSILNEVFELFEFLNISWEVFTLYVPEDGQDLLLLLILLTQLLQLFLGSANPLHQETLLVHILAFINHRCIQILLNHFLRSLRIWPNLCLSFKRTWNYSAGWDPTQNRQFTHLLNNTFLPFLVRRFPCRQITDIREFHFLPSHAYNCKKEKRKN